MSNACTSLKVNNATRDAIIRSCDVSTLHLFSSHIFDVQTLKLVSTLSKMRFKHRASQSCTGYELETGNWLMCI